MRWISAAYLALLLCLCAEAGAQRSGVLLDPAHGGNDAGARLSANLLEKELTLAFAAQVAAALKARNIPATETRTEDTTVAVTERVASSQHAQVCLSLHATASGSGVHVFTALAPAPQQGGPLLTPWSFVQRGQLGRSQEFSHMLSSALNKAGLPVLTASSADAVLNGMNCPAVSIELAPTHLSARDVTPEDTGYQQRVAAAIADAVAAWRTGRESQ